MFCAVGVVESTHEEFSSQSDIENPPEVPPRSTPTRPRVMSGFRSLQRNVTPAHFVEHLSARATPSPARSESGLGAYFVVDSIQACKCATCK